MSVSIEVTGPSQSGFAVILTPEALEFVADLNCEFNPRRKELLGRLHQFHDEIQSGKRPTFLEETRAVRVGDWQVARFRTTFRTAVARSRVQWIAR